jgi:hypothetical protein
VTNALGIAAVTAVLKDRLNDAVINANVVADVRVSAQPPDGFGQTDNPFFAHVMAQQAGKISIGPWVRI